MSTSRHFVICIENGEYAGTLELRKVYEVLEDATAAGKNFIRVIDESAEDYLYPSSWFVPVALPQSVKELLHEVALR